MLDLLVLLPVFMVGLLSMTFQVSIDELVDDRRSYFSYRKYEDAYDQQVIDKGSNPANCQCICDKKGESNENGKKPYNPTNMEYDCPIDTPAMCPHGFYFHPGYCRCIPINGEYHKLKIRQRPPV